MTDEQESEEMAERVRRMGDVIDNPTASATNTDRELWRSVPDDYYAPSVFVTDTGGIGMNSGGMVYVMTVEEWIERAEAFIKTKMKE